MNRRTRIRRENIIGIADEVRDVLPDPLDSEVIDLVEDCTGYALSRVERRLAIVAYDEGAATARRSIWFTD